MTELYVGLMSGTSMDGIDAVLVSFENHAVDLYATHRQPYPDPLRAALWAAVRKPMHSDPDPDGILDKQVAEHFLIAANAVITAGDTQAAQRVLAIGSHGQTLRHQPNAKQPYSLQIGRPAIIANGTGLTTIANFRNADIAAGGQGAPLVPPFHEWLFAATDQTRVVVNIGGIANITVLPLGCLPVTGFDTGPGNGLMDAWIRKHHSVPFDDGGKWAAGGTLVEPLLERFLGDEYFSAATPKSTGFEYFNLDWLAQFDVQGFSAQDVQTTLCELSARSVADSITASAPDVETVFVCGGGVHNKELMRRLAQHFSPESVQTTHALGLDPDWVEAVAFAWLAMKTLRCETGNLPSVTGASHKVVLGDIHLP
jgi:anhydro-N-acetylmuramic acid kinase